MTEAMDTTSPAGRMMMMMVGAFAEFERANCVSAQNMVVWTPYERMAALVGAAPSSRRPRADREFGVRAKSWAIQGFVSSRPLAGGLTKVQA
ncbi:hypothetical protein [Rhizobium leguminosarum]|uniref:hypothetical protein n=1 Tax=Rhizobium leguminosarum TaxID=384 RepID=UPI001AE7371B|nr:hypothetical protein [Rhizobium leguminosarum]